MSILTNNKFKYKKTAISFSLFYLIFLILQEMTDIIISCATLDQRPTYADSPMYVVPSDLHKYSISAVEYVFDTFPFWLIRMIAGVLLYLYLTKWHNEKRFTAAFVITLWIRFIGDFMYSAVITVAGILTWIVMLILLTVLTSRALKFLPIAKISIIIAIVGWALSVVLILLWAGEPSNHSRLIWFGICDMIGYSLFSNAIVFFVINNDSPLIAGGMTTKQKLRSLARDFKKGNISQDEYNKRRKDIINSL